MAARPELTSTVITDDDAREIDRRLAALADEVAARSAFLLDRSGQVIVGVGDRRRLDVQTLGALVAANFASAREIARLLGEDGFHVQLQQGDDHHVLTQLVTDNWLLAIVFGRATNAGLVRVLAARAVQELQPLYAAIRQRPPPVVDGAALRAGVAAALDVTFRDPTAE